MQKKMVTKEYKKIGQPAQHRLPFSFIYNIIFYLKTKRKAKDPIGWIIRPHPDDDSLENLMEQYFNMFSGNENIEIYNIGDSFDDFRIMYENKVANSGQVTLQTIINGINNLKSVFDNSSSSGDLFKAIREMFIMHGGKELPNFLYSGLTNFMNEELENTFKEFENAGGFKAFIN